MLWPDLIASVIGKSLGKGDVLSVKNDLIVVYKLQKKSSAMWSPNLHNLAWFIDIPLKE